MKGKNNANDSSYMQDRIFIEMEYIWDPISQSEIQSFMQHDTVLEHLDHIENLC